MQKNITKAKLRAGQAVFGCFMRHSDASLVELIAYQGWDFIVIDGEHGTIEPASCEHMVRAAELHNVTPIVRVTTNQPPIILRFMDTGAQGLHVPWVNSAEEAEAAVQAVKYKPRGIRGLAGVRAASYAQIISLQEYVTQANEETLVVIHIETAEGVDHLKAIIEVDGVDVIFIGPTDLSHSYGVPGQVEHPIVQAAIKNIEDIVTRSNVSLGIMVGSSSAALEWIERGAQYITIGMESLLCPPMREYLNTVRHG